MKCQKKNSDRWSNETKTSWLTFLSLCGFKALASITCFVGFWFTHFL